MSNATLKEQLQAVASQLSEKLIIKKKPKKSIMEKDSSFKPKSNWLDHAHYGIELLKVYFPACFKAINEIKPLKKGIKEDLVKRLSTMEAIVTEDKICMLKSLTYYVNTLNYHKNMLEASMRIDLDGNPAGQVSAAEAQYAQDRVRAKQQKKRLAEKI